ncbi:MAG: AAA family ATPase [Actinomycetota bacterium]
MVTETLVGRRRELGQLHATVDAASAGRGGIVLLSGEPGIGKTHLAEAAAAFATSSGFGVRWSSCWEGPSAPFWPWTQLLRSQIGSGDAIDVPDVVLRLAGRGPVDKTIFEGDAESVRFALFDAVATYFRSEASSRPLLLVMDDLHWADVPSLRLLEFFAHELRTAPIALVGTYRDVEIDQASEQGRSLQRLLGIGEAIRLHGLRDTEVAELLASGGALAGTDFARAVHTKTGGNPLFVRELARLLSAQGPGFDSLASLPVPEGVNVVIQRRLARLSQRCSELLEMAAVFGQEFRLELLARATEHAREQVLELVEEGIASRLVAIAEPAVDSFVFSHALIRDAVYDAIPLSRRTAMHARAAGAIELSGRVEDSLAELAHHFLQASVTGDPAKAIDYSVRAGRRALEQLAYEDAVSHFQRTLGALELDPTGGRRGELLLDLGDAQLRSGDMPSARAAFLEAAALARKRNHPEELARAALGFGAGLAGFEIQLFDQRQVGLLEEALDALEPVDSPMRAWLLARLSVALAMQESVERRRSVAEDAVAMARRVGERRALAYALAAHCDAIAGPDHSERRLEESSEVVRIAREVADRPLELLGRRIRIVAHLEMGNVDAANADIEAFDRLAEIIKQPLYAWYVSLWRGMRALLEGRFEDAMIFADEAESVGARAHSTNAPMLAAVLRFMALTQSGRPLEARAASEILFELMPEEARPYFDLSDAWLFGQAGDIDRAHAAVRRVARIRFEVDSEWLPSMCQLSEAIASLGDRALAATAYDQILPYRSRFGVEGIGAGMHGSMEFHLGLLARTLGRLDAAEEHLAVAVEANHRMGAPLLEARTRRELAALMLQRQGPGDVARSTELGAEAAAIYRAVGLDDQEGAAVPVVRALFRREGDFWSLGYEGSIVRMKDAKGLHDLASLLQRPGREVAALDLATERGAREARAASADLGSPGDAGEILDEQARAQYRARLVELEEEIEEADSLGDAGRATKARAERDVLAHELSSALGLGGRARRAGDPAERARTTVTRRIREAITRISGIHPALGAHFRHSVRTGTFCVYDPEQPPDWTL